MATLSAVAPTAVLRLSPSVTDEFLRTSLVVVGLMFPVFYWLTWGTSTIFTVAAIHGGVILLAGLVLTAVGRVEIRLTADGVDERGFFGRMNRIPKSSVDRVVLNQIYIPQGAEYHRNLFALDARNRVLLRMRGQFWSRAQMDQVAQHLSRNIQKHSDRTTFDEIRRAQPQMLYWFERWAFLRRGRR